MKSFLLAIIAIFVISTVGCKKTMENQTVASDLNVLTFQARESSLNEIEKVLSDENFDRLVENDNLILNYTDTLYTTPFTESRLESILAQIEVVDSLEFISVFEEMGVPNAQGLINLFHEKYDIISTLVENEVFIGKSALEISTLLTDSYEYYLEEHPYEGVQGDKCAQYYQSAMAACDREFRNGAFAAVGVGVIAAVFTGGVGGIFTGSAQMAIAYANHASCAKAACQNYHICMGYPWNDKEKYQALPYMEIRIQNEFLGN